MVFTSACVQCTQMQRQKVLVVLKPFGRTAYDCYIVTFGSANFRRKILCKPAHKMQAIHATFLLDRNCKNIRDISPQQWGNISVVGKLQQCKARIFRKEMYSHLRKGRITFYNSEERMSKVLGMANVRY